MNFKRDKKNLFKQNINIAYLSYLYFAYMKD